MLIKNYSLIHQFSDILLIVSVNSLKLMFDQSVSTVRVRVRVFLILSASQLYKYNLCT